MTPRKSQRGVAIVEFTLVAPLLLFLMLAVAEFGRAFVHYTVLANSVRDAARYISGNAITDGTGIAKLTTERIAQTRNLAVYGNTAGTGSALLPAYVPDHVNVADVGENNIQVTVLYPYQAMLGTALPTFGLGDGKPISLVFNMRIVVVMRAL